MPQWANKAANGREAEINTCIACNQACLDRIFVGKNATCLVNPRAARETELILAPVQNPRRICVVGAGPAGLACAVSAAERGHDVTLFEQDTGDRRPVPFRARSARKEKNSTRPCATSRVQLAKARRECAAGHAGDSAEDLISGAFDEIVVAAGVRPRVPHDSRHRPREGHCIPRPPERAASRPVRAVAIIGAGGIGFDVATFLTAHRAADADEATRQYCEEWGIDMELKSAGGLLAATQMPSATRTVYLLQRKAGRPGATLGKTTGWAHRVALQAHGVEMRSGVTYQRIDDQGLHITGSDGNEVLDVDSVIVCAGQESCTELLSGLPSNVHVRVIGGARLAAELDAERAIREGTELAATLCC